MPNKPSTKKPLTIFYSYAHEDEKYTVKLIKHLSILRRNGIINDWHDRKILAGGDWEKQIDEKLRQSDVIILLVTAEFISSNYCWSVEMKAALQKDKKGTATIIPIIVKPVLWQFPPLKEMNALPRDGKPVVTWNPPDNGWLYIAEAIKDIYDNGIQKRKKTQESAEMALPQLPGIRKSKPRKKLITRKPRIVKKNIVAAKKVAVLRYKELKRNIYDAQNLENLPGKLAMKEGDVETKDTSVNQAYDWLGICYQFFREIYDRDSIDGKGSPIKATVHYGAKYENVFWTGKQIVCGDGDGQLFKKLPFSIEIIAKQFCNGVAGSTKLVYWGQSGALMNSVSLIFACLIKQYYYRQTVDEADWLFGKGILKGGNNNQSLYDIANPGNAYKNHKILGDDQQPAHMNKYCKTELDDGGIHLNSGIPNRAFYLTAHALGGFAWEKAGRIWYQTLIDSSLKPKCTIQEFAHLNLHIAEKLFDPNSREVKAVKTAWKTVGVDAGKKPSPMLVSKKSASKKASVKKVKRLKKRGS